MTDQKKTVKKAKQPTYRIMKKIMKTDDTSKVAFFPSDQWLFKYLKKEFKTNENFRGGILNFVKPAAYAVGVIGLFGTLSTLAIMAGTFTLTTGLIWGAVTAVAGVTTFKVVKNDIDKAMNHFNENVADEFKRNIGIAYAKHKGSEIKSSVQQGWKKLWKKTPETPAANQNAVPLRKQFSGAISLAKDKWRESRAEKRAEKQAAKKAKSSGPKPK